MTFTTIKLQIVPHIYRDNRRTLKSWNVNPQNHERKEYQRVCNINFVTISYAITSHVFIPFSSSPVSARTSMSPATISIIIIHIYTFNVLSMVSLRITYFLSSGKVGGLTDLTSAAAANGLLVGISQDHLESSKSVSRLYGTQHMTSVASAYPENIQGMGLNVLIFMHFD